MRAILARLERDCRRAGLLLAEADIAAAGDGVDDLLGDLVYELKEALTREAADAAARAQGDEASERRRDLAGRSGIRDGS